MFSTQLILGAICTLTVPWLYLLSGMCLHCVRSSNCLLGWGKLVHLASLPKHFGHSYVHVGTHWATSRDSFVLSGHYGVPQQFCGRHWIPLKLGKESQVPLWMHATWRMHAGQQRPWLSAPGADVCVVCSCWYVSTLQMCRMVRCRIQMSEYGFVQADDC